MSTLSQSLDLDHLLEPDETVLFITQPGQNPRLDSGFLIWHGWAHALLLGFTLVLLPPLAWAPVLLAGTYLLSGRFLLDAFRRHYTRYVVTTSRVLIRQGWRRPQWMQIPFNRLKTVRADLHTPQRGDVVLTRAFSDTDQLNRVFFPGSRFLPVLENVPMAREIASVIRQQAQRIQQAAAQVRQHVRPRTPHPRHRS